MKILIVADNKNENFIYGLCNILEDNGGILCFSNDKIGQFYLYEPKFLITENKVINKTSLKDTIIIKAESTNGASEELMYKDKNNDTHSVKIGTDFKDDITLSSTGNGEMCVSVQQPIKTIQGKEILPFELKAKIRKESDIHTLLTAIGILIISDNYSFENKTVVL